MMSSMRRYAPGDEVFLTYGALCNLDLLGKLSHIHNSDQLFGARFTANSFFV